MGLGADVTRFQEGDRVVPIYTQAGSAVALHTRCGPSVRSECRWTACCASTSLYQLKTRCTLPLICATWKPTLPIAALTAWTTLHEGRLQSGQWVLAMGTGGVALFALQFAKLAGAQVAVISSSDDKLARTLALGADATVNYRDNPDWAPLVRHATDGRGVDIVVETAGTLSRSLGAAAFGAFVGVIGFSSGHAAELDVRQII
jgi:NADPH:quinone reductase-like Zn-dependent oxidoreductase